MDKLFNHEHMGYVGTHRAVAPVKPVLVAKHARYHFWHFVVITTVGLPSIGAWEMIIKPIMEVARTIPIV